MRKTVDNIVSFVNVVKFFKKEFLEPNRNNKNLIQSMNSSEFEKDLLETFKAILSRTDVADAIIEFGLDKPSNLIRFFVDFHFAYIDSVFGSLNQIEKKIFEKNLNDIKGIKRYITVVRDNPDSKESKQTLSNAVLDLFKLNENIQSEIKERIKFIREVDNRPRYMFFIRSTFDISKVDTAIEIIKKSIEYLTEVIYLYYAISPILNLNLNGSIQENIQYLVNEVDTNDNRDLLLAYDIDRTGAFWKRLESKIKLLSETKQKFLLISAE